MLRILPLLVQIGGTILELGPEELARIRASSRPAYVKIDPASCGDACAAACYGGSGPAETGSTVVDKTRKRPRLGKDGLAEADQTNLLLDKWKASDVEQLVRVFKRSVGEGVPRMDRHAFFKVFSELQDLPESVAGAAFDLFDRRKTGSIDFREFCTAVAICCLSSREEQVGFVFDLFDVQRTGTLTPAEVRMLLQTAVKSMRQLSSGPGAVKDDQWIKQAEADLLSLPDGDGQAVTRAQFERWAESHLGQTKDEPTA